MLQRMPFFGGISDRVIGLLLERSTIAERAAGEYFFRQGDRDTSAFVLESGEVAILRDESGRQHLLRKLETGDCFGEMALIDFGPRSASVRALSDCRAIELTAKDLLSIAGSDPEQFAMIYMNLGRELSRRLRVADDRMFTAFAEKSRLAEGWHFASG